MVYGGTALNIAAISDGDLLIYGIVDFPFSLVGDTLLLPFSIPMELDRKEYCDNKKTNEVN